MGSTVSRPRLSQVAPCHSQEEEGDQQPSHPKPQWTVPVLPVDVQRQSVTSGGRTTLPPLKRETTLSALSGSLSLTQSCHPSIIHSHPPRRQQTLQPPALQIGHRTAAYQIVMGKDNRDGGAQQYFTTSQSGLSGTSKLMQGGFLEAQTALIQQGRQLRRARHRQAREQRGQKIVYTVNGPTVGDPNTEGLQRLKLVKRPTERDIFWDECRGESLDLRYLLQPSPPPALLKEK